MAKSNPFGGKNPHGMYVPLTDDELEVLERLALSGEFKVVIKDGAVEWGHVTGFQLGHWDPPKWDGKPLVTFGDKNIHFYFFMHFNAPVIPQPNWYFDMEVWAVGHKLYAGRLPTETGGKPIQIVAGMSMALALDVSIDLINPSIVKEIKPKAVGLTTRHGNMKLDVRGQRLLTELKQHEAQVREVSRREAEMATKKKKKVTGQ
jgi:hypothetical protein